MARRTLAASVIVFLLSGSYLNTQNQKAAFVTQ